MRAFSQAPLAVATLAVVVTAALAFSACGDDDETTTQAAESAGASGPCDLLDDAAVAERLGEQVEGVEQTAEPTYYEEPVADCTWTVPVDVGIEPEITVTLASAADYDAFLEHSGFEESSSSTTAGGETTSEERTSTSEPVDGLGEEAQLLEGTYGVASTGTGGWTVVTRTGENTLAVGWNDPDEEPTPEDVEALAREALAGL